MNYFEYQTLSKNTHLDRITRYGKVQYGWCMVWKQHNRPAYILATSLSTRNYNLPGYLQNPHGKISNSDLELAGHFAHNTMLASLANIDSATVSSYTCNTLALYWTKKGSTSTSIPATYILRMKATHQQHYCYYSKTSHIVGTANVMADVCSWLWHLKDKQLQTHFSLNYPQNLQWKQ